MGGMKRHIEELEEIYGPVSTWDIDWEDPEFFQTPAGDRKSDDAATAQVQETGADQAANDIGNERSK